MEEKKESRVREEIITFLMRSAPAGSPWYFHPRLIGGRPVQDLRVYPGGAGGQGGG